jgi:hypothetical protein
MIESSLVALMDQASEKLPALLAVPAPIAPEG